MLAQVVRGALALGMGLDHALNLAARIAGDCVPLCGWSCCTTF